MASCETVPDDVWAWVEGIEDDLKSDLESTDQERQLILQISCGVSDLLRALRTDKNAETENIRLAIGELKSSLERRQT